MSENKKKLKEMNQNSPLFFVLKTVTYILDEVIQIRKNTEKLKKNGINKLPELEKKVDELAKYVLAIAKGLPPK